MQKLHLSRLKNLSQDVGMKASIAEHVEIVQALRDADTERCETLMSHHVGDAYQRLHKASLPKPAAPGAHRIRTLSNNGHEGAKTGSSRQSLPLPFLINPGDKTMKRRILLQAAPALILYAPGLALAQPAYPSKPIRYIVPVAAGGGSDMVGRTVTERWGKLLNQTFVVDNQGGGGGVIACQATARAPPDGYTLMQGYVATHGTSPATRKLPYDAIKDFTPIGMIGAHAQRAGGQRQRAGQGRQGTSSTTSGRTPAS